MERFELVFENGCNSGNIVSMDDLLGKVEFPKGCLLPAVGVVIINDNNEILLQKRSAKKFWNPSIWGIPGGKVNYGEDNVSAAIRETYEEIGIMLKKEELELLYVFKTDRCYYTTFIARKNVNINECVLQEEEVQSVCYYNVLDIANIETEGFEWLDYFKKTIL